MTFDELLAALEPDSSGRVSLREGSMGAAVDTLIRTCYNNPANNNESVIVIAGATLEVNEVAQYIKIAGKSSILNAGLAATTPDINLTGVFNLDALGEVNMVLRYALLEENTSANHWKFSRSFDSLPTVTDWSRLANDSAVNFLDEFSFAKAEFVVATHTLQDTVRDVPLEAGINFVSELQLQSDGILSLLKNAFSQNHSLKAYGRIVLPQLGQAVEPREPFDFPWQQTLSDPTPGIHLTIDLASIQLGENSFDEFKLQVYTPLSIDWLSENPSHTPLTYLTGQLSVSDSPVNPVKLQLVAEYVFGAEELYLYGLGEGLSINNLADLVGITGGDDLGRVLPDSLWSSVAALSEIELTMVGLGVSASQFPPIITYATCSIGLTDLDWQIWEGHFQLEELSSRFEISNPFDNASRELEATLYATTKIENLPVNIYASSREGFTFHASIADAAIPLDRLLGLYASGVSSPADLTIDRALLTVNPGKEYRLILVMASEDAVADNTLKILLGNGRDAIEIKDLELDLRKTDQITAEFFGTTSLQIGDNEFGFSVGIAYASGQDADWHVDARSIGAVPIGDLMQWLLKSFNVREPVPSSLQSMELSDLYFTADIGGGAFRFGGSDKFELAGHEGNIRIAVELDKNGRNYEVGFKGDLVLPDPETGEPHLFSLAFGKGRDDRYMAARYQGELTLQKVIRLFAEDIAVNDIPPWLSPTMKEAVFLITKQESTNDILLGLKMELMGNQGIDLSNLEFAGRFISTDNGDNKLGVSIDILMSTTAIETRGVRIVKSVMRKLGSELLVPDRKINKGFTIDTVIEAPLLGDDLILPVTGPSAPAPSPGESAATSKTDWKPVGKKLGPVFIDKAGFTMEDGRVKVLLDAGMEMGGFTFRLLGFGIKIPIKADIDTFKDVDFGLDGLELEVVRGDVRIAGGFLKQALQLDIGDGPELFNGYAGEIRVSVGPKSLSAYGGFVNLHGTPSFFIYAVARLPLGGPPEFFIDGFAAGFGLNSRVDIPPIERVRDFIMVRSAFGEPNFAGDNQSAKLSKIFREFPPALDRHWIAIGIKANHYKFVESFLLATIGLGDKVELDILGLARLKMPKGAEALTKAELAMHAHFAPADGFLGMEARISDGSYVLNPLAKLSGGFAFYSWFDGPHKGDFVITLGGYNPRFIKPPHYPVVPRLSLNYQVSSDIYIKGSAYFALTPKMLMAGGRLEGVVDLDLIQAWFAVEAHFLMNFKPFEYFITSSVTIGATLSLDLGLCTIRKTIQIGADMQLWGPDFGGVAVVDLDIVEFEIEFGKSRSLPQPISWDDFSDNFLPPEDEMSRVIISKGIVRELEANENLELDNVRFVVNPANLEIIIENTVPAKLYDVKYLDQSRRYVVPDEKWTVGIGPMNLLSTDFESSLRVQFEKRGDNDETGTFSPTATSGRVPAALWGSFMDRSMNNISLLGPPETEIRKWNGGSDDSPPGPLVGLKLIPEKQPHDVLGPHSLAEVLSPDLQGVSVQSYLIEASAQEVAEVDVSEKSMIDILVRPNKQFFTQLRKVSGFEHLPGVDEQSFMPEDRRKRKIDQQDLDQFEDAPLMGSLGAQRGLIQLDPSQST